MGKMIVYQLLPRLWGNLCPDPVPGGALGRNGSGKFSAVDDATLGWLRDKLKVTHVWFTGIIRHATTESFGSCAASSPAVVKGLAGSPYAITDYFDVNPYLADNPGERMSEFESLLKRTHEAGLKALIDFVPNHVSRDYGKVGMVSSPGSGHPLGKGDDPSLHWRPENDFYYYPGERLTLPFPAEYYENPAKASGNCFSPSPGINDWYETVRLNYCDFHTATWDKMYEAVRYWCLKGVDGFRCDMVEMVPWQFMKWLIARIKEEFPGVIFIAEVYSRDLYRRYTDTVGFDFLYDKSGLYDAIRAIHIGYGTAREITWNWQFLGDMQPRMLNFLENHDEQRFASPFFAWDSLKAGAPLCDSLLFNTSPFMIYSGQEVGEAGMDAEGFSGRDGRTTIFDWWSVGSLRRLYRYIHEGTGLEEKELETLDIFEKALALSADPVVAGGKTFDLGYCNAGTPGFNPDRQFVFLRGNGERNFLFVCNFSSKDACFSVHIPSEAFEYSGTKKTEASLIDVSVKGNGYIALPV